MFLRSTQVGRTLRLRIDEQLLSGEVVTNERSNEEQLFSTEEQRFPGDYTRPLRTFVGSFGEVAELAGTDARAYVIHWFVSRTARHLPSTFSSTTVAPE